MKLLLVPTWLEDLIVKGVIGWVDLESAETLSKFLTSQDLASLYTVNELFREEHPELAREFSTQFNWGVRDDTFNAYSIEQRKLGLTTLEVEQGTLVDTTKCKQYIVSSNVEDTMVVTVDYIDDVTPKEALTSFYDHCLRLLYAHQPFEAVSSTALFKKYLRLL